MIIEELAEEIRQEVLSRGAEEEPEHFREDHFTEIMIEYLAQASGVDEGEICYYRNTARGEKLNGFSLSGDSECVDLFVSSYNGTVPPASVPSSTVNDHFRWLTRFFESALKGDYRRLEEASPVFDIAQQIHNASKELTKARFYLLTDGIIGKAKLKTTSVEGIEISYHLWDLEKLRRFISSERRREVIEIDFAEDFGGAVPCLEVGKEFDEYRTFLAFFSGSLLANLYEQYGPRLLEKNVRSFLQAKGKINKGIRKTILEEPQRFLAYNNGISVTAEAIDIDKSANGPLIRWAKDFQIVNGGQTTASIYSALKKDKANLDNLMVQVKLTVLNNPKQIDVFVPLISQYANSQNKVNAADFSANHPFHIQLEELSRRLWAPSASGTERETHWYYERARGSYIDDKNREGTPARKRAFEIMNPLRQKFTKTDLAKYENTWNQQPHWVCLGAEKNFFKYTVSLTEKNFPVPDDQYFHRLVAKAILFKTAEKIVGAQNYGGYRANIVTYSLAWLSHYTSQAIDLENIWKEQKLPDSLCVAILLISKKANEHIVNPPATRRNPGEWSKKDECWEAFRDKKVNIPDLPLVSLEKPRGKDAEPTITRLGKSIDNPQDAEMISRVMKVPAENWFKISRWAKETNNLLPWHRALAFSLGQLAGRGRTPSAKQANHALKILEESQRLGFKV